jgi:hypothetical protein
MEDQRPWMQLTAAAPVVLQMQQFFFSDGRASLSGLGSY